ncbi:MAG: hypothetical protein AABY22_08065 [Nanoarchaeota archaeon]
MFSANEQDPRFLECTDFDIVKLEDCQVGDEVCSETGTWKAFRYKDEWCLIELIGEHDVLSFKKLGTLKNYLLG